MAEETQLIKDEIEDTKRDLGQNLLFIENRVSDRVRNATTVVEHAYEDVRANARQFSPFFQIQKNPLATVGATITLGLILGKWLGNKTPARLKGDEPRHEQGLHRVKLSDFRHEFGLLKNIIYESVARVVATQAKRAFPPQASRIDELVENVAVRLREK